MTPPVVTPLQDRFWRACEDVILRHSNPWELDEALVAFGYGIGPCAAQDLVGLDVVLAARGVGAAPTPVLSRMVNEGRLGRRVGWGFYRYPGGGGAVVDPLIEDLVREEAWFAKLARDECEGAALVTLVHGQVATALRACPQAAVVELGYPAVRVVDLIET
ncbi:3-hydroxyacyl-CoA dehydrogenase family protein [uncultured Tateyamaria sp.]|uniref:3-hydroxyacyl-CoA dehydrogenase family protein n=1 Tax=uncultured Tateyamaria sp. TaxID=455651 RepID=UPI0026220931|nr:3-hydroxyacyl-CoA dehydrogenase family protein [uncultured Tateyamaria sp.]